MTTMLGQSWKIYWNEYVMNSYLYGSEISFHGREDVEFSNDLVPPGTVLNRWYSKTNYQAMRIEPSLPMIDGEGKYRITLDADAEREDALLLKIRYLDRYDMEVGSCIIRDKSADFQCTLNTSSYEVQLISAGTTHFHFHTITITEVLNDE